MKAKFEADEFRIRFDLRRETSGMWNGTPHRLWTGPLYQGYGSVRCGTLMRRVHVVAWELAHGPVPDGMVLDHLCRVRNCTETAHVEPVSNAENIRRGRQGEHGKAKTHCPHGHEYTPANTVRRAPGYGRQCRECGRLRAVVSNALRKERLIGSGLRMP